MLSRDEQGLTLDEIEAFAARIDVDPDVDGLRIDIADRNGTLIADTRNTLSCREKQCFAQALSWLVRNTRAGDRGSTKWLPVCLVALGNAIVPGDQRAEGYAHQIPEIETLTVDQLPAEVRELGGNPIMR